MFSARKRATGREAAPNPWHKARKLLARKGEFKPRLEMGSARYIWLGADKVLDAFTFIFHETEHGLFQVHSYPYSGTSSTFIVECAEDTWQRAGLDSLCAERGRVGGQDHHRDRRYRWCGPQLLHECREVEDLCSRRTPLDLWTVERFEVAQLLWAQTVAEVLGKAAA